MLTLLLIPVVLLWGLRAKKLAVIPQRLIRAIIVYNATAYIGRAVYLLIVNPTPGAGSLIGDARLLQPDYLGGLIQLSPQILLGLVALLGTYYWVSRALMRVAPERPSMSSDRWAWPAGALLVLSWGVRLYAIATHNTVQLSGFVGRLSVLATVGLGIIIICTDWRRFGVLRLIVTVGVAGEAFWTIESTSKAFVLAAALFLYVDQRRRRISVTAAVVGIAAVFVAFSIVQPAKVALAAGDYNSNPLLVGPAQIVARFDLLHATAVAYNNGPGSYLDGSQVITVLTGAWAPSTVTGDAKTDAGLLWNRREEGGFNDIRLASGPIAEGYAIFGNVGVIMWNVILGTAAALAAFMLSRQRSFVLCVFALAVIAQNGFFEHGVLSLNQDASTAFQLTIIALVIHAILRRAIPDRNASGSRAVAVPSTRQFGTKGGRALPPGTTTRRMPG